MDSKQNQRKRKRGRKEGNTLKRNLYVGRSLMVVGESNKREVNRNKVIKKLLADQMLSNNR